MPEPLESRYDHTKEDAIYEAWEKSGYFNPEKAVADGLIPADAEPYSIVLPPPNVTGTLHMGHAAMLAIEDILIRYERMNGRRTLWLPGTDSAAIATQAKVENIIYKKEKKNRHDLGREELLRRISEFVEESKATIINQTKKMGSSLDWSRYAYTMDEPRNRAVTEAFVRMYEAGLIYRGHRIVNWDPKGQTTISDEEIVYEERQAKLYTFRYAEDFPIAIATTRPETKLGDTGVAVHPEDERYKEFIGKEYDVEFAGVKLHLKIVGDEAVDPKFGTGAVGVTPAHSMTDWEIAERHKLPAVQVIDERARIMVEPYKDKKIAEAREEIIARLREKNLLMKEEDIAQNVATAERTGGVVEPLPKMQWFVNVNKEFALPHSKIAGVPAGARTTLKELMRKAVESGQIKIAPERFEKIYFHWIDNLRDWCISRQIWFGHRIPVWYRGEEIYVGRTAPQGEGWEQDPDTLDTWFSSGLWTFSTLGWPEKTPDLEAYHPTDLLETGYDIIFFWVARMILMSGFLLGDIPFKQVYLHGLVRDAKGRKMSKSLDNIMDPLDLIAKYGADAARLSLIIGAGPGSDIKLSEDRVRGYRNFSTKIWNIARFVLMHRPETPAAGERTEAQEGYLAEFAEMKKEVTAHIEALELHLAAEKLYHYVWHRLADQILEAEKEALKSEDAGKKTAAYETLETILLGSLTLLHPFMPFVTEGIYQKMLEMKGGADRAKNLPEFLMMRRWM